MSFGPTAELSRDVALLEDVVGDLDLVMSAEGDYDLPQALQLLTRLRAASSEIALVLQKLQNRLGDQMPKRTMVFDGVGQVKRFERKSRTNWQSDDLFRAVLDSRLVDPDTGEIETQLERVRAVYGCFGYQSRFGELRKRGIDPDDWCEHESRGWNLQIG